MPPTGILEQYASVGPRAPLPDGYQALALLKDAATRESLRFGDPGSDARMETGAGHATADPSWRQPALSCRPDGLRGQAERRNRRISAYLTARTPLTLIRLLTMIVTSGEISH
jgi:hypothetical protein